MPINQNTCCGCVIEADYGTSIITGGGTEGSPYQYNQVDPLFQRPVVRAERITAQGIVNNSPTAVSFTTAVEDSDFMWSAVNPTRLTVPLDGFYLMGFSGRWDSADAIRETFFRANGTTELDRQSQFNTNPVSHDFTATYNWFFQPGDYVEVVAFQTSGGDLNISGDATSPMNLWAIYLGKKAA